MARISGFVLFEAFLLLGCASLISSVAGVTQGHPYDASLRRSLADTTRQVFDVTKFGAVANNDKKDNAQAFMKTWIAACKTSTAPAKMLIPAGSFLVGPVVFQGPCKSSSPIIVEVHGTVKGTTDISEYSSPEWISFEEVNGLVITGNGIFDGQGPKVWHYNDCKSNPDCAHMAASLRFSNVNNAIVEGITSLNPKWFHVFAYSSKFMTFQNMRILAPGNSPNTDGIHLSATSNVNITGVSIATGDDCIAIVSDTHNILVQDSTCGPGHGISVGSLGKWQSDKGVSKIHVKNCTLTGATNGARIKTWGGKTSGVATGIIFEDLTMKNVKNPVIIDQSYGNSAQPSKWQISDVHFRNIKGSSSSKVAVSLGCSPLFPCTGLELSDIDLTYCGAKKGAQTESVCSNAKVTTSGAQNPKACGSSGPTVTASALSDEDE